MSAAIAPPAEYVREGYARGIAVPWWFKMALKITLAHLPVPYAVWERLGIFRHGDLARTLPNIVKSFDDHLGFFTARTGRAPDSILELGPGDSIGHALCAAAAGVKTVYLNDVGDFATRDRAHYRDLCALLNIGGIDAFDRESVLRRTNATYGTQGLKSLAAVPDGAIDFSFSHAVLEHVRRDEFDDHMRALCRVHRPGSLSRHMVDLHDHLGGALNSMRFPAAIWESRAVGRAGFYTNRLTMDEMVQSAQRAGFQVTLERVIRWRALPTPRRAMAALFRDKSEDTLNVCTFVIVLEKA